MSKVLNIENEGVLPINYTPSRYSSMKSVCFNPVKMYVSNSFTDGFVLMLVLGIYDNYFLASERNSVITIGFDFTIKPFRFAITEKEFKRLNL